LRNKHRIRLLLTTFAILLVTLGFLFTMCPAVLAQEGGNGGDLFLPLVARNYDPTWRWSEPITLPFTLQSHNNPIVALDHEGRPHLLWDTYAEPKFIYHTYLDANTWTTPTAVAESLGTSYVLYPPVVDPQGRLHLLWRNQETYEDPNRTLYARFSAGKWSQEEEVYRSEMSSSSLQGMVHLDENNAVHATMVDSYLFTGGIYHTVRSDTGWRAPEEIETPTYSKWIWPDHQGGVRFYGNDYESPPNLYLSYWREGSFSIKDRQGPERVKLPSQGTQLDGHNNLHLFWRDQVAIPGGEITGLYHKCLKEDLHTTPQTVLSGEHAAFGVVKTGSRTHRFALAWQEDYGEWVRIGVWEGCNPIYLKSVPFSDDLEWTPKAIAISDAASEVCVLGYTSTYPSRYELVCADILR
jgi:hypothetical protein